MNESIVQLSIRALLDGRARYVIPMYQRNYAWEEGEISQLIQDVVDTMHHNGASRDYYIGSLVVFRRGKGEDTIFETIDGQQRLTTLSLLAVYLKKLQPEAFTWLSRPTVEFECRPHSGKTFAAIAAATHADDPVERLAPVDMNAEILNGYRLVQKLLPVKLRENGLALDSFLNYLLTHVQIMRVEVPADTDLNHYFEIMNNRGEQLEKHEVLKARLLKALESLPDAKACQSCLHQVWEACANMEKYVQMGFPPVQRDRLFGHHDWSALRVANFDELKVLLQDADKTGEPGIRRRLSEILAEPPEVTNQATRAGDEETPERFNSVITFPHFLLHVLRVETGKKIPLDDKRLLSTFEEFVFRSDDPAGHIKRFVYSLLRCKYLYDHYIIKREFLRGTDGWSLKRLTCNTSDGKTRRSQYVNTFGAEEGDDLINRRILMLLSAFHVSTPTLVYKHWLSAALHYLFMAERIEVGAYLSHLESVARAFVFDRFLAEQPAEYDDMIFQRGGRCQARPASISSEGIRCRLSFGNIENNLVFNYLDYLLWNKRKGEDPQVRDFEFTFRSSVEHHYPRNPLTGLARLEGTVLDSFGNLCLISHSKNSRLSNFTPEGKKEFYAANAPDSIKQYLMMKHVSWNVDTIREHGDAMIDVLMSDLASCDQN